MTSKTASPAKPAAPSKRVLPDLSKVAAPVATPQPDQNFEGHDFRSDFQPCGVTMLRKGRDPLVTYVGEYKGKFNRHLRTIYLDANEEWCPGKGVSFPADATNEIIDILVKNCVGSN